MAYLFCHEHINIKTFHTNYISYLPKNYDAHCYKLSPEIFIPTHKTHCIRSKTAVLFGEYMRFFVISQLKLFRFQEPFWMKKKNAYLEYI